MQIASLLLRIAAILAISAHALPTLRLDFRSLPHFQLLLRQAGSTGQHRSLPPLHIEDTVSASSGEPDISEALKIYKSIQIALQRWQTASSSTYELDIIDDLETTNYPPVLEVLYTAVKRREIRFKDLGIRLAQELNKQRMALKTAHVATRPASVTLPELVARHARLHEDMTFAQRSQDSTKAALVFRQLMDIEREMSQAREIETILADI